MCSNRLICGFPLLTAHYYYYIITTTTSCVRLGGKRKNKTQAPHNTAKTQDVIMLNAYLYYLVVNYKWSHKG